MLTATASTTVRYQYRWDPTTLTDGIYDRQQGNWIYFEADAFFRGVAAAYAHKYSRNLYRDIAKTRIDPTERAPLLKKIAIVLNGGKDKGQYQQPNHCQQIYHQPEVIREQPKIASCPLIEQSNHNPFQDQSKQTQFKHEDKTPVDQQDHKVNSLNIKDTETVIIAPIQHYPEKYQGKDQSQRAQSMPANGKKLDQSYEQEQQEQNYVLRLHDSSGGKTNRLTQSTTLPRQTKSFSLFQPHQEGLSKLQEYQNQQIFSSQQANDKNDHFQYQSEGLSLFKEPQKRLFNEGLDKFSEKDNKQHNSSQKEKPSRTNPFWPNPSLPRPAAPARQSPLPELTTETISPTFPAPQGPFAVGGHRQLFNSRHEAPPVNTKLLDPTIWLLTIGSCSTVYIYNSPKKIVLGKLTKEEMAELIKDYLKLFGIVPLNMSSNHDQNTVAAYEWKLTLLFKLRMLEKKSGRVQESIKQRFWRQIARIGVDKGILNPIKQAKKTLAKKTLNLKNQNGGRLHQHNKTTSLNKLSQSQLFFSIAKTPDNPQMSYCMPRNASSAPHGGSYYLQKNSKTRSLSKQIDDQSFLVEPPSVSWQLAELRAATLRHQLRVAELENSLEDEQQMVKSLKVQLASKNALISSHIGVFSCLQTQISSKDEQIAQLKEQLERLWKEVQVQKTGCRQIHDPKLVTPQFNSMHASFDYEQHNDDTDPQPRTQNVCFFDQLVDIHNTTKPYPARLLDFTAETSICEIAEHSDQSSTQNNMEVKLANVRRKLVESPKSRKDLMNSKNNQLKPIPRKPRESSSPIRSNKRI